MKWTDRATWSAVLSRRSTRANDQGARLIRTTTRFRGLNLAHQHKGVAEGNIRYVFLFIGGEEL